MFLNKLVEPLKDYKIILASGSPRRKEILTNLGVDFKIIKSNFEEDLPHDSFEKSELYCMETAKQKCLEVYHRLISDQKLIDDNNLAGEKGLIISADSIVVKDNKILEKPLSEKDAFDKLSMLRGSSHHVISSLVLIPFDLSNPKLEEVFMDFDKTEVTFSDEITDQDLWAYIETKEPMDKAGGYGYQGLASLFIPKINGCYFNVVGFPIHKFYTLLKKFKELIRKTKGENYNFGYLLIGSGYSQSELERIPKLLDSLLPNIPFQVGLVAEKIGFGTNSKGIRLIAGKKESTDRIGAYPFYFHSPDAKKVDQVTVGRWLTSNDDRSQPKWDRSDDVLKSVSQPTNHVALPQEFIDIGKQYEPGSTLLLGTDGHPDQYLEAISNSLPHLKIVGLSGGPTPFINGKATSLIYNGKVNEEGIIGVILPPSANISTKLVYPNIQTLGEPLTITKARGNIILEMNESNATQHLLKSLQTTNIPSSQYKHIDFFLGLLPKDCTESPQDISIYRIQSGSPTKGTMAIDTIRDIELDQKILFYYIPNTEAGELLSEKDINNDETKLSWMVPSKEFEMYTGSNVTSENGIVYSTKPYFTKICLPGTRVEFDFN